MILKEPYKKKKKTHTKKGIFFYSEVVIYNS